MTAWIGIDPGQKGGVACVDSSGVLRWAMEMPSVSGEVDAFALSSVIHHESIIQPIKVVIEQVHSMPGQGVSTTFKFGKNFGIAIGVVCAHNIALHRITPQKWKKEFNLINKDKDASRHKATEYWPEMSENWRYKYQNGVSDAALIAEAARRAL